MVSLTTTRSTLYSPDMPPGSSPNMPHYSPFPPMSSPPHGLLPLMQASDAADAIGSLSAGRAWEQQEGRGVSGQGGRQKGEGRGNYW